MQNALPNSCAACAWMMQVAHDHALCPVGVRVNKSASELFWIVSVEARQAATTLAVLQTSDGSRMRERLHGAVDRAAHEFCKRNARLIHLKTIALLWSVDSGLQPLAMMYACVCACALLPCELRCLSQRNSACT